MDGTNRYEIRQCVRSSCSLRFPVVDHPPDGDRCPRCGASTRPVLAGSLEREHIQPKGIANNLHLEVLLDNLRSAWNVGSIFRTGDGMGIRGLHLCGMTPTPDNPKVAKTSLGAERSVPWWYYADGLSVAHSLIEQGYSLWALEHDERAVSLVDGEIPLTVGKIGLVVGNEITGVDPGILALCERVVFIPMQGVKRSLNVAVAFGIAVALLYSRSIGVPEKK